MRKLEQWKLIILAIISTIAPFYRLSNKATWELELNQNKTFVLGIDNDLCVKSLLSTFWEKFLVRISKTLIFANAKMVEVCRFGLNWKKCGTETEADV